MQWANPELGVTKQTMQIQSKNVMDAKIAKIIT